jgi:phthalate 4,5-dioxygenase oxygenase subunit
MLTKEENELLVRTGPGTPMGNLMRRYWIPVVFSKDLPKPDCPPLRVKLLHEKLVVFRDSSGHVGLVDERCPHRGASVFFGRNEEDGLRCVYHGWKFDTEGRCVDMPSEPPESNFKSKVRITAYPCEEHAGMVWAYMGPPEHKPGFPKLEWTVLPASHVYVTKHMQECNWFQALEGGFDSSHVTFLHRREGFPVPALPTHYEPTPFEGGLLCASGRTGENGTLNWAVECMVMPFHKLITYQPDRPLGAHVWVPIDDETCMNWSVEYQPHRPLNEKEMDRSYAHRYIHTENVPGTDRMKQNPDNDYLIDREMQASGKSYTGIACFGVQDAGIQESMGAIADRTTEHLGTTDIAIIQLRRYMFKALKALDAGELLPGTDPESNFVRVGKFAHPKDAPVAAKIRQSVEPVTPDWA